MEINFINSVQGKYLIIKYDVTIYNEDDGAHFPVYNYSGTILFSGDAVNKDEQEIYDAVLNDFRNTYKERFHMTLEEQAKDPAFRGINIRVESTVCHQKYIEIKP